MVRTAQVRLLPPLWIRISNSKPMQRNGRSPPPVLPRSGGERMHRARLHDLAACICARYQFISRPLRKEGAGNAGRSVRPIAACAMVVVERTRVSQVTPESPGIPHAMVYGLYVLSPVIGLF